MPLLTIAALKAAALLIKKVLLKKFLVKLGVAYASGVLREIATNPAARHVLERVAEDAGWDGVDDLIDFLSENFDTIGDLVDKISDKF